MDAKSTPWMEKEMATTFTVRTLHKPMLMLSQIQSGRVPQLVSSSKFLHGIGVGDGVGASVGAAVGLLVGAAVGLLVGATVGLLVGVAVGLLVVGTTVGATVGAGVGNVGAKVNDSLHSPHDAHTSHA